MPARQQQRLQFSALRTAKARIVRGPRRQQPLAAAQAVGQQRDGQRIAFGRVVRIDRVVVLEHEERRPRHAGRHQHRCCAVIRGQRLPVDAGDPLRDPLRQWLAVGAAGLRDIEACRQLHFVAPRLAGAPAGLHQIVRGRGQRVGNAVDQVASPIAIEVDRDAFVRAGHELRVAERPGPRSGQPVGTDVAGLQQLQRGEEFAAEERLSPAEARERRQRHQQRPLAEHAAVVALHAPHRDDGGGIHAIGLRYPAQQFGVRSQHGLSIAYALLVDQGRQIVPQRRGELGLRVQQVQHAHVGGQALGVRIEAGRRDALLLGDAAQAGHAGGEHRIRCGRWRRRVRRRGDRQWTRWRRAGCR